VIVLMGGGSSLAAEGLKRLRTRSSLAVFSRSEPQGGATSVGCEWVPTTYSEDDGSLGAVARLRPDTVIWLAAPFPRGLYLGQSRDEIRDALRSGIEYQSLFVQEALRYMVKARMGRFIFVGSRLASLGDEGALLYMVVKGAQKALSKGVALEYGRFGVTSNVIELGPLDQGYARGLSNERVAEYRSRSSRRFFVSPTEFWDLAISLLDTPCVNGAEVVCDGGFR
jgi:NAD(P)-dependent dehydrogenase (short-subunit alcohol dehydrogenase family)